MRRRAGRSPMPGAWPRGRREIGVRPEDIRCCPGHGGDAAPATRVRGRAAWRLYGGDGRRGPTAAARYAARPAAISRRTRWWRCAAMPARVHFFGARAAMPWPDGIREEMTMTDAMGFTPDRAIRTRELQHRLHRRRHDHGRMPSRRLQGGGLPGGGHRQPHEVARPKVAERWGIPDGPRHARGADRGPRRSRSSTSPIRPTSSRR